MTFINNLIFDLFILKYQKMIIILEISMCSLLQKHIFIHFLNIQKLLIYFNQIDVIVGKSLVMHIYSLVLFITVLKNVEKF